MIYLTLLLFTFSSWELPAPIDKEPVPSAFFKDRLHAYIWLNWSVVPISRIADTIGAKEEDILAIGTRMGLPKPYPVTEKEMERLHCTITVSYTHLTLPTIYSV